MNENNLSLAANLSSQQSPLNNRPDAANNNESTNQSLQQRPSNNNRPTDSNQTPSNSRSDAPKNNRPTSQQEPTNNRPDAPINTTANQKDSSISSPVAPSNKLSTTDPKPPSNARLSVPSGKSTAAAQSKRTCTSDDVDLGENDSVSDDGSNIEHLTQLERETKALFLEPSQC